MVQRRAARHFSFQDVGLVELEELLDVLASDEGEVNVDVLVFVENEVHGAPKVTTSPNETAFLLNWMIGAPGVSNEKP